MARASIGYLEVLRRFPEFRKLYLARTISLFGDWFNLIALLSLLREKGQAGPVVISALFIVKLLPQFFMGFPAGVAADRFNRKRILLASDAVRFVLTLLLFAADLFPGDAVWIVLGLTGLSVSASAFFEPARSASLPILLPRDALGAANALGAVTWSLVYALGAGIGGVVTEFLGWRWALALDASTFVISAIFVLALRAPLQAERRTAGTQVGARHRRARTGRADLIQGLRFARRSPGLLPVMLLKAGWCFAGATALVLALYGQSRYHFGVGPDFGIALLMTARAVGTGLGPLVARRWTGENLARMRRAIALGYFVGALFYVGFSISGSAWGAVACTLLAHVGGSTVWVLSTILLQRTVPNRVLGRITALELAAAYLMISTSNLVFGQIAEVVALDLLPMLLGLTLLVPGCLWAFVSLPRRYPRSRIEREEAAR